MGFLNHQSASVSISQTAAGGREHATSVLPHRQLRRYWPTYSATALYYGTAGLCERTTHSPNALWMLCQGEVVEAEPRLVCDRYSGGRGNPMCEII